MSYDHPEWVMKRLVGRLRNEAEPAASIAAIVRSAPPGGYLGASGGTLVGAESERVAEFGRLEDGLHQAGD